MPRETFFNLEESKREKILEAAVKEFTQHELYKCRVSNIIKEASIPRGSFYQYFVDIDDLYYYVIDKEFNYIFTEGLKQSEKTTDLFEFVRLTFEIDMKGYFDRKRQQFMKNVFKSISNNFEYLEYHNSKRREYITDILEKMDLTQLRPMSEDELIEFYEFLQNIKSMVIRKSLTNNQTPEVAMASLERKLSIIEYGVLERK